jgi:hypothetical protein
VSKFSDKGMLILGVYVHEINAPWLEDRRDGRLKFPYAITLNYCGN